ncbi:hypothetical protein TsFJ059_009387 [Trichoderma semiorbis]|uniref:Uncharacterized protein n=1 Tax=Trichoderma semiorbis TaxID=1491008 RepID=A0A9P8HE18_9HYPO|nr:hypothetical protein TsFJ059_009387 [Trichoderma semiorbis]
MPLFYCCGLVFRPRSCLLPLQPQKLCQCWGEVLARRYASQSFLLFLSKLGVARMTTTSSSHISSHGGGSQNVQTGDGPQYNNNAGGHQFNHNNFYGTNMKDPAVEEAEKLQKEKEESYGN